MSKMDIKMTMIEKIKKKLILRFKNNTGTNCYKKFERFLKSKDAFFLLDNYDLFCYFDQFKISGFMHDKIRAQIEEWDKTREFGTVCTFAIKRSGAKKMIAEFWA